MFLKVLPRHSDGTIALHGDALKPKTQKKVLCRTETPSEGCFQTSSSNSLHVRRQLSPVSGSGITSPSAKKRPSAHRSRKRVPFS